MTNPDQPHHLIPKLSERDYQIAIGNIALRRIAFAANRWHINCKAPASGWAADRDHVSAVSDLHDAVERHFGDIDKAVSIPDWLGDIYNQVMQIQGRSSNITLQERGRRTYIEVEVTTQGDPHSEDEQRRQMIEAATLLLYDTFVHDYSAQLRKQRQEGTMTTLQLPNPSAAHCGTLPAENHPTAPNPLIGDDGYNHTNDDLESDFSQPDLTKNSNSWYRRILRALYSIPFPSWKRKDKKVDDDG